MAHRDAVRVRAASTPSLAFLIEIRDRKLVFQSLRFIDAGKRHLATDFGRELLKGVENEANLEAAVTLLKTSNHGKKEIRVVLCRLYLARS